MFGPIKFLFVKESKRIVNSASIIVNSVPLCSYCTSLDFCVCFFQRSHADTRYFSFFFLCLFSYIKLMLKFSQSFTFSVSWNYLPLFCSMIFFTSRIATVHFTFQVFKLRFIVVKITISTHTSMNLPFRNSD